MNGVGWSCFTQLPAGLIDPQAASLTLNWLRPKPTHAGFKLKRDDVDAERYARNLRIQRQTLIAGAASAVLLLGVAVANVFKQDFGLDPLFWFTAIWAGASAVALALMLYLWCAIGVMRFRRAEPRREAFRSACEEFERIDAWRTERCDPAFWSERVDDAAFKQEAAELLAGHFRTGQVMLTQGREDYGVDVLLCAPWGRVVARCEQWKGYRIGISQVRELAGSKAFFVADRGVFVCLHGPGEDQEASDAFARALQLDVWDLERIVAVATQLREPM